MVTAIEELTSKGSNALAPRLETMPGFLGAYALGPSLFHMLQLKNGFYAFESALHVFPVTSDPEVGLEAWNAGPLWRNGYGDMAEGLLFFAEDVLQDQFCLSQKEGGVLRFYAETGKTTPVAESLEAWARVILSNYKIETGSPLAHAWQAKNGPLPPGTRLMPKTPFFLGGEYNIENLWVGNPLEGMRFKADLANQTRDLPEGARVKLQIAPKPEQ